MVRYGFIHSKEDIKFLILFFPLCKGVGIEHILKLSRPQCDHQAQEQHQKYQKQRRPEPFFLL